MTEENSILTERDYGKIVFHIGERMDERGIKRNQLARRANMRFEVANRYYHGNVERPDADILARICHVLECGVEDIMEYCKAE